MSQPRTIINLENGETIIAAAKWCDSFLTKLRGFTFRSSLNTGEGLVLVSRKDTRVDTAIHMLFVGMDLGVIWVNNAGIVVDTVVAKPWKLSYTPQKPARYVIEGEAAIVAKVKVGDHIQWRIVE